MPAYHYTNLLVELHGLTFRVAGAYTSPEPALPHCPPIPAEFTVKLATTTIKGQPEAYVGTVLESMRGIPQITTNPLGFHHVTWTSGLDELESLCLRLVEAERKRR